jgi:hypothetical protein
LTPELQAEAAEYAAQSSEGLEVVYAALEDSDVVAAREGSRTIKRAADALRLLLMTGKSMRQAY